MKKIKILITGSSGYIGSCLVNFLNKKIKDIYGLDKKKPNNFTKIKKKNFIKCNLLNKIKLEKEIKKINPDIIIHLAGKSTINQKIKYRDYFLNNIVATSNLIKIVKKLKDKKIIFSSTAAIYKNKNKPIREFDKIDPVNFYAKTKFKVENLIKKNIENFVILRFFNVCSSLKSPLVGENHRPETHLLPLSVNNALLNKTINIYGKDYPTKDGTCVRDYIHIKDICTAIYKSIFFLRKNRKGIFNLGASKQTSNKEFLDQLSKFLKQKLKIKYVNRRKGDTSKLVCNFNKAKKKLNWFPINSSIKKIIKDQVFWTKYLIKKKYNDKISSFRN